MGRHCRFPRRLRRGTACCAPPRESPRLAVSGLKSRDTSNRALCLASLLLPFAFILLPFLPGCRSGKPKAELEFWLADFNPETRVLLDTQLIPRFEKLHPGLKVNTQYISWAHLDEKLAISFAGGVQPDVFQIGAEYVGGLAYRGMAQPLDDRIAAWGQQSDFYPASWNTCVY